MRDNTEVDIKTQLFEPKNSIRISHLPEYDIVDYDLSDEKDFVKYIKDIERVCRNSRVYKKMIEFLREHVDMSHCSFYKNINNLDTSSIKIHIHHSPLTLFDIVNTVFKKRMDNKQSLTINMVAKEVMWLHYNMVVGLIPLSETVHELAHSGFLFIPTTHVYGDYKTLCSMYERYIDPHLLQTLRSAEEYSMRYDFIKETRVLTMQMVYIDPSGAYEFPRFEDIACAMQEHISNFDSKVDSMCIIGSKTQPKQVMPTINKDNSTEFMMDAMRPRQKKIVMEKIR